MADQSAESAPGPAETLAALVRLAGQQFEAGKTEKLLETLRQVLRIDPDHAVGLYYFGVVCQRTRRFDEAIPALERLLELMPKSAGPCEEYFVAFHELARALIAVGRGVDAASTLESLRARVPDNEGTRNAFAVIHYNVALDFQGAGQAAQAICHYREALTLSPGLAGALGNLRHILAETGARALLSDYTSSIGENELRPYLFIACMPKSGSSFLKTALCALTGYQERGLTFAYMQNEQELYLPYVTSAATIPVVTQQHCRATEANIQMMQAFGIRPVVLVRNLTDVVASLHDFYSAGATSNTFFAPYWPELTTEERLDLIIDHVVPWYLAFYASWAAVERSGRLEFMWMSYRELTADKPAALTRIGQFYGLDTSPARILPAIAAAEGDRNATRFNKGVAGRGEGVLTKEQKARMARLASAYRGLDFSPIGL